MISIKKAGVEDIFIIQSLAEITWPVAYGNILPQQQLRYMLDLFYSKPALEEQMLQKGHRFVIAFDNDEPAGFAAYSPKYTNDTSTWRLHKLYVDPNQQGKGTGKQLLDHIAAAIKPQGAAILELNVNRQNKAIDFYTRYGFKITSEEDIAIGNGYFMNDYVMSYEL